MKSKQRYSFHQLLNSWDHCSSTKKDFKFFIAKFVLQDQHLNLFGNLFKGLAKGGRLCLTKRGKICKSIDYYNKDFFAH